MENLDNQRTCYGLKSLIQSLLIFIFFGWFYPFSGLMTLLSSAVMTVCIIFLYLIAFFNVICVDDNYIKVKGVLSLLRPKSVIEVSKISKAVFRLFLTSRLTTETMKFYDEKGNVIASIPMVLSYKERKLFIEHLERLGITVE